MAGHKAGAKRTPHTIPSKSQGEGKQTLQLLTAISALFQTVIAIVLGIFSIYLIVAIEASEKRIQEQLSTIELNVASSTRMSPTRQLTITDLGPASDPNSRAYRVRFEYEFVNNSDKKVEVSYAIVHALMAETPELTAGTVINLKQSGGDLAWVNVLNQGNYFKPNWTSAKKVTCPDGKKMQLAKGGGGTGILHSGETSAGMADFVLVGKPGDAIAVKAAFGFDDNQEHAEHWKATLSDILPNPET